MGRSTDRQVEIAERESFGSLMESAAENSARTQAQQYVDLAVKTLARVMRSTKTSPSAKVSAAREMLAQAYGKPTQQVIHSGDGGGFNVQIIQFSTGQREEHVIDVPVDACPQEERLVSDEL